MVRRQLRAPRSLIAYVTLALLGAGSACEPDPASTVTTAPEAQAATESSVPSPADASAVEADATSPSTPGSEPAEPSAPEVPVDPIAAPDAATLAKFMAGPQDDYLDFDKHYVKSNESRHDVWFPYIDGLGGAYVGVGADQNYTLIARARSEWVFLLDIDPRVGETHWAYKALIEKHDTPTAFLANFEPEGESAAVATIEAAYAHLDEGERKRIRRGFRAARETLRKHLARVSKRSRNDAPSTWLSDPAAYDWIRRLYLAGRVRIMPGDLTGAISMKTVGANCEQLGTPVGVLYLSNAEEYFKYFAGEYRQNVAALPGDADSIVLRTLYGDDWVHADSLWNYQVQPLSDFASRLADTKLRSRNSMIRRARAEAAFNEDTGVKGVSEVGPVRRRE